MPDALSRFRAHFEALHVGAAFLSWTLPTFIYADSGQQLVGHASVDEMLALWPIGIAGALVGLTGATLLHGYLRGRWLIPACSVAGAIGWLVLARAGSFATVAGAGFAVAALAPHMWLVAVTMSNGRSEGERRGAGVSVRGYALVYAVLQFAALGVAGAGHARLALGLPAVALLAGAAIAVAAPLEESAWHRATAPVQVRTIPIVAREPRVSGALIVGGITAVPLGILIGAIPAYVRELGLPGVYAAVVALAAITSFRPARYPDGPYSRTDGAAIVRASAMMALAGVVFIGAATAGSRLGAAIAVSIPAGALTLTLALGWVILFLGAICARASAAGTIHRLARALRAGDVPIRVPLLRLVWLLGLLAGALLTAPWLWRLGGFVVVGAGVTATALLGLAASWVFYGRAGLAFREAPRRRLAPSLPGRLRIWLWPADWRQQARELLDEARSAATIADVAHRANPAHPVWKDVWQIDRKDVVMYVFPPRRGRDPVAIGPVGPRSDAERFLQRALPRVLPRERRITLDRASRRRLRAQPVAARAHVLRALMFLRATKELDDHIRDLLAVGLPIVLRPTGRSNHLIAVLESMSTTEHRPDAPPSVLEDLKLYPDN